MLRHAAQMRRDPLSFLTNTAAELGDVVVFPVPGPPVLFVDEPHAVQRVLRDNHRAYGKRTVQYDTLALVTGQGLLTADLDPWRSRRRVQQPAFHHRGLHPLVDIVVTATDRLLERWRLVPDGAVVDVDAAMMRLALEVVGEALFSTDLSASSGRLAGAVMEALDEVIARAQNPLSLPTSWPAPGNRRLRRALVTLDEAVATLVARRRRDAVPGDDLLGLLVASGLDERAVRDEVVTALVAGHETVASSLTWAWDHLGRHDDACVRLCTEVDEVLVSGRRPAWDDLAALGWTRQVVDETLRLRPPAWVITRRALRDDVLAHVPVTRGSLVIMSPYALHRRPDVWPEPDRFDPERFAPGRTDERRREAYVPFGSGPRLCIGRDLALVEATVVLARISQSVHLAPTTGVPPRPQALVTIRPERGLPMVIHHRSHDHPAAEGDPGAPRPDRGGGPVAG